MVKKTLWLLTVFGIAALCGCWPTHNLDSERARDLESENNVVVVRPDRYVIWGTRSVSDYLRITYCNLEQNQAGQPVVKMGLRNIGGAHWWSTKGKNYTIYVKAVFYKDVVKGKRTRTAPLYRTNKQPIYMKRGEVSDIVLTSPVKGAKGYQVVISEN